MAGWIWFQKSIRFVRLQSQKLYMRLMIYSRTMKFKQQRKLSKAFQVSLERHVQINEFKIIFLSSNFDDFYRFTRWF